MPSVIVRMRIKQKDVVGAKRCSWFIFYFQLSSKKMLLKLEGSTSSITEFELNDTLSSIFK